MTRESKNLFVGLDIGTSKIVAIVGQLEGERLEVIGLGQAQSDGLKKGVVVNIEATVASIQKALEEAELMADCKIASVWTGIAGSHIRSFNSSGMVAIKEKEVSQADMDRVIETATAVSIPADQQVLHVLPQEYIIDGQEDVREPLGMSGVRLEVRVHIVTGAVSAAQNIIKCIRRCGLEVEELILQPLASSHAVLTEDERELGVALVDIGGGTTDIAIFAGGAIRHTAVIPIAGDQITNDIAMALRTPTRDAEEIKCRHGVAKQTLVDPSAGFEVPGLGDRGPRMLSQQSLAAVIEPRVEELFSLVAQVIRESGFEELLSGGVVLTGGSAQLPGMIELGEDVFLKQVRVAKPSYRGSLADVVGSPRYATAMGLLEQARFQWRRGVQVDRQTGSFRDTLARMKSWFVGNF
ncbi:MAG: cell division protein FtsA [Burkholderiaceae bacterium]|jgi:cell division protein FtsA|nr:cell division protein FtsA [Burkholderiaceae bacterium]MDP4669364.1 cell division protein FtsA [Burkholderiaceae bacterium]MDP4801081.1 cell division protein FtsA [Burkholderiaceae bacterium]